MLNIRSIWIWILPVPLAFLVSVLWLRWTAFFLPVVLYQAPYGIISFFRDGFHVNRSLHHDADGPLLIGLHVAFWLPLILLIGLRSLLPKWSLWIGWAVLVLMLSATLVGCSRHFQAPYIH